VRLTSLNYIQLLDIQVPRGASKQCTLQKSPGKDSHGKLQHLCDDEIEDHQKFDSGFTRGSSLPWA
jgi:hypothetical protein